MRASRARPRMDLALGLSPQSRIIRVMSSDNEALTPPQDYGIERWGGGYFCITKDGRVAVSVPVDEEGRRQGIDLVELAAKLRSKRLGLPVLVRFDDILSHRAHCLFGAFEQAAKRHGFNGGYRAVYPIKVNQQRTVVERIVSVGKDHVGLEAGSKPELLVVLASAQPGSVIVCNGYKDREYVRLALIGLRMGYQLYIVIEKPGELALVLRESDDLGIEPLLGVRMRLAAVASGNWQNSGGSRSKFGLSTAQALDLLDELRAVSGVGWLQLLHAHIGSQIPDLQDIQPGVEELARFYAALREAGVPIAVIDVGGGLGVDYEGTGSPYNGCSSDYDFSDYADAVLAPIARICAGSELPHPMVVSESGRAMTAHHAVLITDVSERESVVPDVVDDHISDPLIERLREVLRRVSEGLPQRHFREATRLLGEAHERFGHGGLGLAGRAAAESLFLQIADGVRRRLRSDSREHRKLLDELNPLLADRVFCNFSLFQSLPDAWGIGQVFPILPLQRLNERPERPSLLHDLTCDSDGTIADYVDGDGVENTLALHEPKDGEPYLLGIFLVGAYQEILGDMHNLFGDTHAINVVFDENGCHFGDPEHGDTVMQLLEYVHFNQRQLEDNLLARLGESGLGDRESHNLASELVSRLSAYSYLAD